MKSADILAVSLQINEMMSSLHNKKNSSDIATAQCNITVCTHLITAQAGTQDSNS